MTDHIDISQDANADIEVDGSLHEVASDLAYQRLAIVNVAYVGAPGSREWVLVDAGIPGTKRFILNAVTERFGEAARPAAIVMTHGHFDHVGVLNELAEEWDVPIYAHELELAYLNGMSSYREPDPSVGGGMMSILSRFYPRGPIDVSRWLRVLPEDGSVPPMRGWRWVYTPGHTTGHVSFWREADRSLIAGDAFITTNQESAYAVAAQKLEIQGPPMYFTPDWNSARSSVQTLAKLEPELAITGHGRAIKGSELREGLQKLANNFDEIAVPDQGKYVP
ncbi:MAG TPA: MBL fold metallo-hydrolase [Thermomicrobiales bacterium]|nr:MBL fold metallo-hydrolase [Thermomicrobiales bacterium]